ncbi:MAG: hypothetical protein ABIQ29_08695 [Burkholderiaceae bacterium]
MFEEPGSLPMRAAMASFLGGLFGIAMILYTHVAHAQEAPPPELSARPSAVAILERLGDATLHSLRGSDGPAGGVTGMRGLRLRAGAHNGADAGGGLRWQAAPARVLRSEIDNPRSTDQVSVGLQIRF